VRPDDANCLWEAINNVSPIDRNLHLYPDAAPTVRALDATGYRLALVTARPVSAAIVARELRQQGLPDVFEAIVTSGDVGYRKPHLLVFESALRELQLQPEHAVVVGDSYECDIVPAASLGMIPVLKLNEREPDPQWVLARHQILSLAALLQLDLLHQG
jgi:HAD superfamily hydrolase (TIGR01509 family)